MIWRGIFAVVGGAIALRVAANAWVATYYERPFSTLLGTALVLAVLIVLGSVLVAESRDGQEVRRASAEYGPRYTPPERDTVETIDHVVHHVVHHVEVEVTHVHRYESGEATTVRREPYRTYVLPAPPDGSVVDGEVVQRAIEGGHG